MNDELFMKEALLLAKLASKQNEVPVGSVVVFENEIIGKGYNQNIASSDPTAHAEIIALKQAGKKTKSGKQKRHSGFTVEGREAKQRNQKS